MTLSRQRSLVAALLAFFVGACGVAPHVAFSIERGTPTWFFNSYDEGYYGWASLYEPILHRVLAGVALRGLTLLCGENLQMAMIAADFLFPAGCALAACFAAAAVTRSALGMGAAALFLLTAAETLAFRSIYTPFYEIYPALESAIRMIDGRPDGWFVLGNPTGVFWLFRTPEPQVTWAVLFVLFGFLFRLLSEPEKTSTIGYAGACLVGGLGYMPVMFPVYGALCFAGLCVMFVSRPRGLAVFLPAMIGGIVVFALSMVSALRMGAESLVFESREPALMFSGLLGLAVFAWMAVRCWKLRVVSPLAAASMALSLASLLMANQQLVTGRMLYLLNFENFAFAQILGAAILLAIVDRSRGKVMQTRPMLTTATLVFLIGLGATIAWSQVRGYRDGYGTNVELQTYADAVREIELSRETRLVCRNLFVADNLAIVLGWRPNYLLGRDLTFSKGVERLRNEGDIPASRSMLEPKLFETLALSGTTPAQFENALKAVINPSAPNWEDRFLTGAFLYSQMDFWEPLTHGRSLRSEWIAAESPKLVAAYSDYLSEGSWPSEPTVVLGKMDREEIASLSERADVSQLGKRFGPQGRRIRAVLATKSAN